MICGEETSLLPELTNALPLEYLERLLLQNQVFGDRIVLEGIAIENEQLVVLTSQPELVGVDVSGTEMRAFMEKNWFAELHGLSLGRPGALAFFRDLDEIAAFDAHPGNFVKDGNGVALPIDLILVRPDAALQKALATHRP